MGPPYLSPTARGMTPSSNDFQSRLRGAKALRRAKKMTPSIKRSKSAEARGQVRMWQLYILKCNDGSFYTGISANVIERLRRHNHGKGAKHTRVRRPVELVYCEQFKTKSTARCREVEIKKLSILNKERLIKFGKGLRFPSAPNIF